LAKLTSGSGNSEKSLLIIQSPLESEARSNFSISIIWSGLSFTTKRLLIKKSPGMSIPGSLRTSAVKVESIKLTLRMTRSSPDSPATTLAFSMISDFMICLTVTDIETSHNDSAEVQQSCTKIIILASLL